jgi:tRNA-splicing ligase RtcB
MPRHEMDMALRELLTDPEKYASDPLWGELAARIIEERDRPYWIEREQPAPYRVWGEGLEKGAVDQMDAAVRLPVAVAGALMPDAHQGYGLPIGGVLATENAVIPYAVGVDIACRMKLSVFDIPASEMKRLNDSLVNALKRETLFGAGAGFQRKHHHDVLDEDWSITPITKRIFDKARHQIGTSGSGNHFVEFGTVTLEQPDMGLQPGEYLALLSHSGSRGAGAQVADHYSRLARDLHPELPPELKYLAWLDLSSEPGQEYFAAMGVDGQIRCRQPRIDPSEDREEHRRAGLGRGWKTITTSPGASGTAGRDVIVHRKGRDRRPASA